MKFYVVGDHWPTTRMFYEWGYIAANHPVDADMCVFTGSKLVDPSLYRSERDFPMEDPQLDSFESNAFFYLKDQGKLLLGINRGAILMQSLTNGAVIPNLKGHEEDHPLKVKSLNNNYSVASFHKQGIYPSSVEDVVVAYCPVDSGADYNIEVIYKKESNILLYIPPAYEYNTTSDTQDVLYSILKEMGP